MPFPAATITSNETHGPPTLGAGCPTVLICKKPAWRVGDQHTCPVPNAPPPVSSGAPHGTGITAPPGVPTVLIDKKPAAQVTTMVQEPGALVPLPPPNPIMMGAPTVLYK